MSCNRLKAGYQVLQSQDKTKVDTTAQIDQIFIEKIHLEIAK